VRDIAKDKELCEKATPGPWGLDGIDRVISPTLESGSDAIADCYYLNDDDFIAESREALPHYIDRTEKAEARVRELEEALREIAKGEGPFSRDHLKHAANCIESMKNIAITALAGGMAP